MHNLFDIAGHKAIVTGACGGLGRGMAEALLEAECEVVLLDMSPATEQAAADYRAQGYNAHALVATLGSQDEIRAAFDKALELLGGHLDIIVNAAGIQRRHFSEEFPIEDWDAVINVNLTTVFTLCQLAGRQMIAHGGGKIINIASMLSYFGGYTVPAYAASKGGVAQLTKALANEWASKGININALAPGYMDTPMNVNLVNDPVRNTEILNRIPAKRWGTPDDMKGSIIFLASKASDYLNGAVIPVDGGYLGR